MEGVEYVAAEYTETGASALRASGVMNAVVGDGLNLPFRDSAFDVVGCHDVLEHVLDPERLISEMCRVSAARVVLIGPNYVGPNRKMNGHYQTAAWRYLGCILGRHRRFHKLGNPHLTFDDDWNSDADAVSGVNVAWVIEQLRNHGYTKIAFQTWDGIPRIRGIGRLPFTGIIGLMMQVVADRE